MDWPVLVDPLNLLGAGVVPIAFLIDEQGVVREMLRDPRRDFDKFTAQLDALTPTAAKPAVSTEEPVATLRRVNDVLLLTDSPKFDDAIRMLDDALRRIPDNGALRFARGVAHRERYDSRLRRDGDFTAAVADWQRALDSNPNQYIWRRRIQQYGPRLEKPYPFYDWVEQARRDIRQRGETPVELVVEPAGSELAGPTKELSTVNSRASEPDPKGRIARDRKELIRCEVTVVPPRIGPGQAARVHIVLRPNPEAGGHWNNEGDPLVVWIDPPAGWVASDRILTTRSAPQPVSDEPRSVEFELRAPADSGSGTASVPGYALYGVCEGPSGTCLYRRVDLAVPIRMAPAR